MLQRHEMHGGTLPSLLAQREYFTEPLKGLGLVLRKELLTGYQPEPPASPRVAALCEQMVA